MFDFGTWTLVVQDDFLEFAAQVGGRILLQMIQVNVFRQYRIAVRPQKVARIHRVKDRFSAKTVVRIRGSPVRVVVGNFAHDDFYPLP